MLVPTDYIVSFILPIKNKTTLQSIRLTQFKNFKIKYINIVMLKYILSTIIARKFIVVSLLNRSIFSFLKCKDKIPKITKFLINWKVALLRIVVPEEKMYQWFQIHYKQYVPTLIVKHKKKIKLNFSSEWLIFFPHRHIDHENDWFNIYILFVNGFKCYFLLHPRSRPIITILQSVSKQIYYPSEMIYFSWI